MISVNHRSANYDLAAANIRHKPVESDMPGTTLGIIPLQAFKSGGVLHGKYKSRV